MQETWVQYLGRELLEKGMATSLVFLPVESHGQRSLMDYSPQGHKELDVRVRLCATLGTLAGQAPVSTGFSRQEYWSRLP